MRLHPYTSVESRAPLELPRPAPEAAPPPPHPPQTAPSPASLFILPRPSRWQLPLNIHSFSPHWWGVRRQTDGSDRKYYMGACLCDPEAAKGGAIPSSLLPSPPPPSKRSSAPYLSLLSLRVWQVWQGDHRLRLGGEGGWQGAANLRDRAEGAPNHASWVWGGRVLGLRRVETRWGAEPD